MMPLPKEETYTTKDIYALPAGERAELIDGKIYDIAPPSRIHQKLVQQFSRIIGNYIADNKGACEVYPAPFAVFLNQDDKTYVEPDVTVVCDADWIVEIVSPGSYRMDYLIKLFKYRTAGVKEYWIVNPMKETVQTYFFEGNEDSMQYSFEDEIPVSIYSGFLIRISELLA